MTVYSKTIDNCVQSSALSNTKSGNRTKKEKKKIWKKYSID